MIDLLSRFLYKTHADHAELRYHTRRAFSVTAKDGEIERISNGLSRGIGVRTLIKGSWGFSSTTSVTPASISQLFTDAESLARTTIINKKRLVEPFRVNPIVDKYETPLKRDPKKRDKSLLVTIALEADKALRQYSDMIVSSTISLSVLDDEILFLDNGGAQINQRIVRCLGNAYAIAEYNGQLASASEGIGKQGGLEVLSDTPVLNAALAAAERAVRIAPEKMVPGGRHEVVLEDRIVGLLAHEAIGHCAEADLVVGGSFLADKIGSKVASDKIDLVDDGRFPEGIGTMKYDDEGTATEKTFILKNGIAEGFLHSRETASIFKVNPTGNARAWSFEFDPIIRMRNTYIERGDETIEELIEGVKEGYFLKGGGSGQADFNGEFTFGTQEAVKIENGKLKETYKGATIGGNAFAVLLEVSGVGKDFYLRSGICGKEQINYVGAGGPSIRTKILIGGR